MMSGGSHDYAYHKIDRYRGDLGDEELDELLEDFRDLLRDAEWYHSGDHGEETFEEKKQAFKEKWLERDTDGE